MKKRKNSTRGNDFGNLPSQPVPPRKVSKRKQEYFKFFMLLKKESLTCSEACERLGIWRPNGCRLKRKLERAGLLREIGKRICRVTRYRASVLTTNRAKFPFDPQTKIWQ